jgi:MOSC domain-containing protein YiiM
MGSVLQIFIADKPAQPMRAVPSVEAVTAGGLKGDRKLRQVTLIETEAIEAANRDYALLLEPIETRRNILTQGVALNHLVGREFTVGPVRLKGLELCEPCAHLEGLTRKGVLRALIHRGGLRAQVLEGGSIRVGDAVETETCRAKGAKARQEEKA